MNHKTLARLCAAIWISFLLLGLWPFNFFPRNHVSWVENGNGLRFAWYGIAYSAEANLLRRPDSNLPPDGITVEIWLKPAPEMLDRYAEILSLYRPGCRDCFAIMQSGDTLRMNGRYRNSRSSLEEKSLPLHRYFSTPAFSSGAIQLVTVTAGQDGTTAYLDDQLFAKFPGFVPAPETLAGQLVLGHAPFGQMQWSGQISGLAIYDRALDRAEVPRHYRSWAENRPLELAHQPGLAALYTFDEAPGSTVHNLVAPQGDLLIPRIYRPLQKTFLESPSARDFSYRLDVILNVFGFVPFGFLFASYFLRSRGQSRAGSVILSIGAGFLTSLTIELLQAYLPSRDSSMTDLINNIVGTAVGSLLAVVGPVAHWLLSHPHRRS